MSNPTLPKAVPLVSLALATYNGQTWLPELLASLEAQRWPNLELVVADDASTDNTPELLRHYAGRIPLRLVAAGERVGIVRNFERAIAACKGDYIALVDQDDVWTPEKISSLMQAVQAAEAQGGTAQPVLAFCDIELVDAELKCLSPSLFAATPKCCRAARLRDFFLSNHIPGCAMLLNRAAVSRALPFPAEAVMHDWWLALIVAAFGEIRYVAAAHLKYRQHGGNAVSAGTKWDSNAGQARHKKTPVERQRRATAKRQQIEQVAAQIRCFSTYCAQDSALPERAKRDLAAFVQSVASWPRTLRFVLRCQTGVTFMRSLKMMRRLRGLV
ncbi:glycosyltransferase family 2 protein [Paraburkholderia bonniea]|uniref:glycosyltransferase family 2 protein n=1 Tax=Paraburkholderia bonniea TaxID=2152891 RepID=UPI0012923E06|nr:glycosyltransferase family 2 protein [Paraburkholderia bonniea]WJF91638.1 glycosyltransferase family 2 protein [Paraburkholderia bonniea]WJF94957.1 glycosyltransferase family 2 protein [Paraburkholderia bonniea]